MLLRKTRTGHHLYAVGGNREVARLSGIRTSVPVVVAHVLCSVLAALAGLLLLARLSVGSPTIGSQGDYDLMSIAAVVLGGTLLAGGKGNILGTIGGVAIFAVMDQVMSVIEVESFLQDVVRGLVIVLAVAVYARRDIDRRPAPFERPTGLRRRPPGGTMTNLTVLDQTPGRDARPPMPAHQHRLVGRLLATVSTPGGAVFVLAAPAAGRDDHGQPQLRRPGRPHPLLRPHRARSRSPRSASTT